MDLTRDILLKVAADPELNGSHFKIFDLGVFLMPSEPQPKNLSAEELQKLSSELSELSQQHADAFGDSVLLTPILPHVVSEVYY